MRRRLYLQYILTDQLPAPRWLQPSLSSQGSCGIWALSFADLHPHASSGRSEHKCMQKLSLLDGLQLHIANEEFVVCGVYYRSCLCVLYLPLHILLLRRRWREVSIVLFISHVQNHYYFNLHSFHSFHVICQPEGKQKIKHTYISTFKRKWKFFIIIIMPYASPTPDIGNCSMWSS